MVMTTEVLRNMLYAGSPTLAGLSHVVLDEVHYLADRFRGAVWEEVIIHLPESVALTALSATVSNAEEFGDWLTSVRGGTAVIVDEHRPVPLWQHMMVGSRLYDLLPGRWPWRSGGRRQAPAGQSGADQGRPPGWRRRGPRAGGSAAAGRRTGRARRTGRGAGRGRRAGRRARQRARPASQASHGRAGHAQVRTAAPGRGDRQAGPGRAAARDHVHLQPGRLRRGGPAVPGREPAADHAGGSRPRSPRSSPGAPPTSRRRTCRCSATTTGWPGWSAASRPITPACFPTFKEVVEELFAAGLIRAVFATETLALGINMPARTVVVEKLDKWNGETHADLTAGEYTQLTGRAGRRGIDVEGHAVVLWQPGIDPVAVAGLAGTRTYPLNSSFQPSYNMAVNLRRPGRSRARVPAARVVVRAVPGRPGGRRDRQAGPPDPRVDGGPGGELRPRRLRRVREDARRALAARAELSRGRVGGAACRGDRVASRARPRRHHRGARRPPGRHRRRARARPPTRPRPAAAAADRAPPAQAAVGGGLPGSGRCRSSGSGSRAGSARARRSTARTWPRRCATSSRASIRAPAAPGGQGRQERQRRRRGRGRHRRAAPQAARAPLPRLPGPRGARQAGGEVPAAGAGGEPRSTGGWRAART